MRFLPILSISLLISFIISCSSTTNNTFEITAIQAPSQNEAALSNIMSDEDGNVFLSWVETNDKVASLYYSKLDSNRWSSPTLISSSDNWFVNWADFPSVIARNGEIQAAHWLNKSGQSTYAYDVNIATPQAGWTNAKAPHSDGTKTEHGFVSMESLSDSTFLAVWLDGRNTGGAGHGMQADNKLDHAMTIRSAVLNNNLEVIEEHEIDASVCDCCGTSTTVLPDGSFISAFRNRTQDEIRDIYVSKFVDGNWTESKAVHNDNWKIAACPVNGPMIKANEEIVAVSWFTAANNESRVKVAISEDLGDSFSAPIIVDKGNPLGRVDLEVFDDNSFFVTWVERKEDRTKATFIGKHYKKDGTLLNEYDIAEMSSSRKSGFPRITLSNGNLIATYTHINEEGQTTIKTLILD